MEPLKVPISVPARCADNVTFFSFLSGWSTGNGSSRKTSSTAPPIFFCSSGLVGFGDIGRKIATRLKGFGTTILAYDPYCTKESIEAFGCVPVSLDELLEQADFVSLHVRLSPQTQNMFGAAEFAKMKPTAIFVNAARAGLVDEASCRSP